MLSMPTMKYPKNVLKKEPKRGTLDNRRCQVSRSLGNPNRWQPNKSKAHAGGRWVVVSNHALALPVIVPRALVFIIALRSIRGVENMGHATAACRRCRAVLDIQAVVAPVGRVPRPASQIGRITAIRKRRHRRRRRRWPRMGLGCGLERVRRERIADAQVLRSERPVGRGRVMRRQWRAGRSEVSVAWLPAVSTDISRSVPPGQTARVRLRRGQRVRRHWRRRRRVCA